MDDGRVHRLTGFNKDIIHGLRCPFELVIAENLKWLRSEKKKSRDHEEHVFNKMTVNQAEVDFPA